MRHEHRLSRAVALVGILGTLAGCGGDDATGFVLRVKVRGINIAAITRVQMRFTAADGARFDGASGGEGGLDFTTEDGDATFVVTGERAWVTEHYELSQSEFVFLVPFENPSSGGSVGLQVQIHREIEGDLVLVGESALTSLALPAPAGEEVAVVVGCVQDGQCAAEIE